MNNEAAILIPGFPELRYQHRCRVCQLAKAHPGLIKLLHRFRRDDEFQDSTIHTKMRAVFERHGVPPPSARAIGRHLEAHVDFSVEQPKSDFDLPDPEETAFERLAAAEEELDQNNPSHIALGTNDSDYHNMADLFRRLMRRIMALDADPLGFITPDGQHSTQRLSTWSSMVDNARRIIEGLNKMRNSDRMTISILEQHTKRYATAIAAPIAEALREIRDDLTEIDDPQAQQLATKLTLLLDQHVTDIFTEAAIKSLRESREKYKLLN